MKKSLLFYAMLLAALFVSGLSSCTQEGDDYANRHGKGGGSMPEDSVELILSNVKEVSTVAEEVFMRCGSAKETEAYFNEIRNMEAVEDVWADDFSMYVKIRDFCTISYDYFPQIDKIPEELLSQIRQWVSTRADYHENDFFSGSELQKICIVNQQSADEGRQYVKDIVDFTYSMFDGYKYDVKIKNSPSVDFYRNEMYDYDIIFLITHGGNSDGHHWLYTSEGHSSNNWIEKVKDIDNWWEYIRGGMISIGTIMELRGNSDKRVPVYYTKVSEKFISKTDKRFKKDGKAILFNVACLSLKGENGTPDYELADAFISRGLGFYLGYDESNGFGQWTGMYYFGRLLSGLSVVNAYKSLPQDLLEEENYDEDEDGNITREWIAHLLYKASAGFHENSCISHPQLETNNDDNPGHIILKASQNLCNLAYNMTHITQYSINMNQFRYGFYVSETNSFKGAKELCRKKYDDEGCSFNKKTVKYEMEVPIKDFKSETTYYYWAYMYDGFDYCLSNVGTFTTPKMDIERVVPIEILEPMEPYIPIYEGENPPDIQGTYVIDPMEIVYDKTGNYEPGYNNFSTLYFNISNQNFTTNTLDYREKEIGNGGVTSESEGKGAFISGEGNNFTVFFNTTGVTHLENYDVDTTDALIISGTKTSDGIRDLHYAFVIVKKSADPDNRLMKEGDFRVFKDGDNWAETTSWPSGTRVQQITVRDGIIFTPWSIRSIRSR